MTRTPEQREHTRFPHRLATYLDSRELTRELVADLLVAGREPEVMVPEVDGDEFVPWYLH